MKRNDLLIIGVVCIVALGFYIANGIVNRSIEGEKEVRVYVDGKLYNTWPMSSQKDILIDTEYGKNTIRIQQEGVAMVQSTCPDHLCEKVGRIEDMGQQIVCLPNRVYVRIEGREDEMDAIAQ